MLELGSCSHCLQITTNLVFLSFLYVLDQLLDYISCVPHISAICFPEHSVFVAMFVLGCTIKDIELAEIINPSESTSAIFNNNCHHFVVMRTDSKSLCSGANRKQQYKTCIFRKSSSFLHYNGCC